MDSDDKYIEMTPQILAILTVQRIASYIGALNREPGIWWFAIQDFDLALYSQLIAFLSGTTQLGAVKIGHQTKMLDYLNDNAQNRSYPTDKNGNALKCEIAPFSELLVRSTDPKFGFINNAQSHLILSDDQRRDILKLHEFRNDLAHVQPVSWYVEKSGLPRMTEACTFAIEHLFKHCTARIHLSQQQIDTNEKNLAVIAKALGHAN